MSFNHSAHGDHGRVHSGGRGGGGEMAACAKSALEVVSTRVQTRSDFHRRDLLGYRGRWFEASFRGNKGVVDHARVVWRVEP